MKLQTKFEKIVLEYTEKFYTIMYGEPIDWDNIHWIGGDLGEVCGIGDYFVSFNDMRYVVDTNVSGDDYRDWYWQNMPPEEGKKYVNLETYLRLKK